MSNSNGNSNITIPILHFNDAYRVNPQKLPGGRIVDVTQFAYMLNALRDTWPLRSGSSNGEREGLVLFSGDLFSPSVESSVTRGSHMVPVINILRPDVAVTGNHEFDFGYSHLTELLNDTTFPWLLSNIVDNDTGKVPEGLHEVHVIERCGVRIGFVGLVEQEWIATVPSWPSNFQYRDAAEVGMRLSKVLRNPEGAYRCDLVIALTHCRMPNDIQFARALNALTPGHQGPDFPSLHGVDLILGGHDHFYYAPKGADSWESYDLAKVRLGADEDKGDVLVAKSGTDFRDLSEIRIELQDTPPDSVRRKVIKSIKGKRHRTQTDMPSLQHLSDILEKVLESVHRSMKKPLCIASEPLDLRSREIRTGETATADWFADAVRHGYDEKLVAMGYEAVDAVFFCTGALRGDTLYGPGNITIGDLFEILPFDDPLVVVEVDGETIWEAFEVGLSTWPATEGRFPSTSGLHVLWDSRKESGQRVLSIALASRNSPGEYKEVKKERGGRMYTVMTRHYMALGNDGFKCLANQKFLIDQEQGQTMSAVVREHLSGRHSLDEKSRDGMAENLLVHDLPPPQISKILQQAKEEAKRMPTMHARGDPHTPWLRAVNDPEDSIAMSPLEISDPLSSTAEEYNSTNREHRNNSATDVEEEEEESLPVITLVADSRLKDVARP